MCSRQTYCLLRFHSVLHRMELHAVYFRWSIHALHHLWHTLQGSSCPVHGNNDCIKVVAVIPFACCVQNNASWEFPALDCTKRFQHRCAPLIIWVVTSHVQRVHSDASGMKTACCFSASCWTSTQSGPKGLSKHLLVVLWPKMFRQPRSNCTWHYECALVCPQWDNPSWYRWNAGHQEAIPTARLKAPQ